MVDSAIKIVADLDKVADNIQSLKNDITSDVMSKADKLSLKKDVQDLIEQLENLKMKI